MHRSGTSLIARIAALAGADFGDPDSFQPPDRWNTDGYFEQKEILAVNMALVNGPFWKFSYFRLPSREVILRRARRHRDNLRELSAKYRQLFVKENRFCLTLPAWLSYGAEIPHVLVVFREPREVAKSLKARNRIPYSLSYRLWCRHYQSLLKETESIPRTFVWYNRVIDAEDGEAETQIVLRALGLPSEGAAELVGRTVRYSKKAEPPGADTYPAAVEDLYRQLQESRQEGIKELSSVR
ncbi:MAG: hypothetical protein QNJ40_15065 [Xanthomonadales bacterium]|nr:hypothetical protein [Xanthomonadales bacterium]